MYLYFFLHNSCIIEGIIRKKNAVMLWVIAPKQAESRGLRLCYDMRGNESKQGGTHV